MALARIIDLHVEREYSRLAYRRMQWLLALYYMMGIRNFKVLDVQTGTIQFRYTSDEANYEFQSTELLSAVDRVQGMMLGMDLSPFVQRVGRSLGAIRERSVAQILMDSLVNANQSADIKTTYLHNFVLLGSCGITGHLIDHPTIGLISDQEIVHPKEVVPFPSMGQDRSKQRGMVRTRVVPLSFLEEMIGSKKVKANREKMSIGSVKFGAILDHQDDKMLATGGGGVLYKTSTAAATNPASKQEDMEVVKLHELWLEGPQELCQRYVLSSGAYIIDDQDLTATETFCPIGWGRFMENGTFHGSGLFDLLFAVSRKAEVMQKQLFKNIEDLDKYGILVMPHGSYNQNTLLRDVGHGLKVFPWEPDPISEGFRPFFIEPYNSRDIPGKTAQFALSLIDRQNPWRDLLREKGRADSGNALAFLDEKISEAITTPTHGLQRAFGTMYRAMGQAGARALTASPRALPVERLTPDLAGAVIAPVSMKVSFTHNPLPNVTRLQFTVKQIHPRSGVARKQEALELQQRLGIDPDSFILFALKEGLDFALWTDEHSTAYESIVRNILIVFGDGETPGQVILTPQTSKPEFQLRVLMAFMNGPIMSLASVEVINAFQAYHDTLMQFTGMVLPEAVPNPDDIAIYAEAQQALVQGQQQPQLQGAR
jgi:hypothetical protein